MGICEDLWLIKHECRTNSQDRSLSEAMPDVVSGVAEGAAAVGSAPEVRSG